MLVGCGSSTSTTPHVTPFTQSKSAAAACASIVSGLPKTLNGQSRLTSTRSPFGAIWGDPAIVLRCGVPEPAAFTSNAYASCLTVNGIDWYLSGDSGNGASSDGPITVTTVYRDPAIEVTVPASYGTQGPSTAMALLTQVIRAHTTASKRCL